MHTQGAKSCVKTNMHIPLCAWERGWVRGREREGGKGGWEREGREGRRVGEGRQREEGGREGEEGKAVYRKLRK